MFSPLARRLRAWAEKDGRGYPDWALRYTPLVRRWGPASLLGARVLEIGANENGMGRFFEVRAIAADVSPRHLRAARASQGVLPAAADVAALPFPKHSFDAVVCMDTFEHLEPEARLSACAEIVRVLRPDGRAVIAFPSGEAAARVEGRVRAAYLRATGGVIPWLEEHTAQGLPEPGPLRDCLQAALDASWRITQTGNAPLWIWEPMWRILMCNWPGRGNAVYQALLRLATPLLVLPRWGTCYRTMLWIEPRGRAGRRDG